MGVIQSKVTFARGEDTIDLSPPPPGYSHAKERAQAIGETAAGTWYVYDKEVDNRILNLSLVLTLAEKDALETFFDSTVVASLNTFTYTDHLGVAHTSCRLRNPRLEWTKTPGGRYRVDLEIIMAADPD